MNKHLIYIIYTIIALILSSCDGPKCIDADDFGFERLDISARYKTDDLVGSDLNQVGPWIDSQLRVNGDPLVIVVKNWQFARHGISNNNNSAYLSAWCPWLSKPEDTDKSDKLDKLCEMLTPCSYFDKNMCNTPRIESYPCLMKKGIGLYGLVITEKGYDPNESMKSMISPRNSISFHLGEPIKADYKLYDINDAGGLDEAGGIIYNFLSSNKDSFAASPTPLYFKILDSYYGDNSGQYKIVIKSGVNSTKPDPIKFLQTLVEDKLFGVNVDKSKKVDKSEGIGLIGKIFKKLITNSDYKKSVTALLTIYLIITGFMFVIGSIEMTKSELIVRIFKIIVISQLLSPSAYSFFYNNLFFIFVDGWDFLQHILETASSTGPGGQTIVSLMLSSEVFKKLFSLLFTDWLGWLFIILYFALLLFILLVYFQATVIILSAKLAIGLMIIVSPIFLCLMLFNFSKPLFEGWFKQLISFTLQPLILYAGLTIISTLVRDEIYASLGFKVCRSNIPDLGDITKKIDSDNSSDFETSIFSWWFPDPINKGEIAANPMVRIPIPKTHEDLNKSQHLCNNSQLSDGGTFCKAYECCGKRYLDLPFLDPDDPDDQKRIKDFQDAKFVNIPSLIFLFLLIYLLWQFNNFAIDIALAITQTQSSFKIQSVEKQFIDSARKNAKMVWNHLKKPTPQPSANRHSGLHNKNQDINDLSNQDKNDKSKLSPEDLKDKDKNDTLKLSPEDLKEQYKNDFQKLQTPEFQRYTRLAHKNEKILESYEYSVNHMLEKQSVRSNLGEFIQDLDSLSNQLNPTNPSTLHLANTKAIANYLINPKNIEHLDHKTLSDFHSRIDSAKSQDPGSKEIFENAQQQIANALNKK
jgi:type IV secretion system protein VirB6